MENDYLERLYNGALSRVQTAVQNRVDTSLDRILGDKETNLQPRVGEPIIEEEQSAGLDFGSTGIFLAVAVVGVGAYIALRKRA